MTIRTLVYIPRSSRAAFAELGWVCSRLRALHGRYSALLLAEWPFDSAPVFPSSEAAS